MAAIGAITSIANAATQAVQAPNAVAGPSVAGASGAAGGGGTQSFMDVLNQGLSGLNSQLTGADAAMTNFASGGSADLHTVMLQMQEASLGLKLGVQVRDKLLEAYQEIMRLQL
jgi:flagellar hook-basal body complex protein FliE